MHPEAAPGHTLSRINRTILLISAQHQGMVKVHFRQDTDEIAWLIRSSSEDSKPMGVA